MIVSGTTISGQIYFEETAKLIRTNVPEEFKVLGDALTDIIDSKKGLYPSFWTKIIADNGEKADPSDKKEDDNENDLLGGRFPLFIHLRNVRYFDISGREIKLPENFFWRGRIDSVDGFFLGIPELKS